MRKKGQDLMPLLNWFIAMILIFGMVMFSMMWNKPWQAVDHAISPQIDASYESQGRSALDIPPQARKNQKIIPVILVGGVILVAFFGSIKRDPNRPYE